ncbi:unnamed protein product [Meloidogyne enterolobii]|uniref:Uncharacterized protein n=1 Tax=Meloidogyne enterolobii TaxID=390850 RepID=A0ACB1AZV5_MELEN
MPQGKLGELNGFRDFCAENICAATFAPRLMRRATFAPGDFCAATFAPGDFCAATIIKNISITTAGPHFSRVVG